MKSATELHNARPTSPHLGIYKPQISSTLSIFHRITGVALFIGLSIVSWWLILWIYSKFDKSYVDAIYECWIVKFGMYITSYGFFYHLCTGIRHLIWDLGLGFSIKAVDIGGWAAVVTSLILTILFWVVVL
jgi:succinate dehydrogenase / fumarate reductase cytochrome b subunit